MRGFLFLILTIGFLCAPTRGLAEAPTKEQRIEQAKAAFAAGTEAYENGDFPSALREFKRAYRLTGSADLLYNIATVADRMRLDEDALAAYEGYIKARPDSADHEHVEGRIRVLQASIAEEKAKAARAKEEADLAAKLAAEKVRAERPLTEFVGPGPGPWITIGASGGVLAVGAVMLALGQRDKKTVENAAEGTTFTDVEGAFDRGPKRTKIGIALIGAGVAGGLAGLLWQLTGGHEETIDEHKKTQLNVGPGGVILHGRF